ncbi:uncharacterized protein N7482_002134 [Penicillium canariense]|uniref:Uncharacterized protein n=1 Tax=Penicillium canariense TaxID=189055 RepID=A0A9W9IH05_9EURO|nr:uncharacterized protein N7482_002134 [Penicillium canariense]KAJ5176257.1 hypothetical protein N7482_002134 [Penicillium canariense]
MDTRRNPQLLFGADVYIKDDSGQAPLSEAAQNGHDSVVQLAAIWRHQRTTNSNRLKANLYTLDDGGALRALV